MRRCVPPRFDGAAPCQNWLDTPNLGALFIAGLAWWELRRPRQAAAATAPSIAMRRWRRIHCRRCARRRARCGTCRACRSRGRRGRGGSRWGSERNPLPTPEVVEPSSNGRLKISAAFSPCDPCGARAFRRAHAAPGAGGRRLHARTAGPSFTRRRGRAAVLSAAS